MSALLRRYWIVFAITGVFLVVFAVLLPISLAKDASRDHSTYRKNRWGCAALADLVESVEPALQVVRVRHALTDLEEVDGLLVILDPERPFDDGEIESLAEWVEAGGRAVIAIEGPWDDFAASRTGAGMAQFSIAQAFGLMFRDRPAVSKEATPVPGSPLGSGVESVEIRSFDIIYQCLEDIQAAMAGMLDPVFEEKVIGHAQVRQVGVGRVVSLRVLPPVVEQQIPQ